MKKMKESFVMPLMVMLTLICMSSCRGDDEPPVTPLIENSKIQEEGQTLSPGATVHLEGNGFTENDNVWLAIYWESGDALLPESRIECYAEILSRTSESITIRMPYRKPASRVEIKLMRHGETMKMGTVYLTDGTTPKEMRLYGINNNLHNKGPWVDELLITRWMDDNTVASGTETWPLERYPDFHSAVGASRLYGACGLSREGDRQYPYFLDFYSQEWKQLSDLNTIALYSNVSYIEALQTVDGENYFLETISSGLDKCDDYAVNTRTDKPGVPIKTFPLPEGLTAEMFGEYPGTYTGTDNVLFSANKSNGIWAPVIYNIQSGFKVLDDVEADGLIPFSFMVKTDGDKNATTWIAGYIVARDNAKNGTELYLTDGNSLLTKEPFAVFPNRAVSASANHDKPGTLTVHFTASRDGNVTFEYSWESKEWSSVHNAFGNTYNEIVWLN